MIHNGFIVGIQLSSFWLQGSSLGSLQNPELDPLGRRRSSPAPEAKAATSKRRDSKMPGPNKETGKLGPPDLRGWDKKTRFLFFFPRQSILVGEPSQPKKGKRVLLGDLEPARAHNGH